MTHYKLVYVAKTAKLTGAGEFEITYKAWLSSDKTRILVSRVAAGLSKVDIFDLDGVPRSFDAADNAEVLGLAHKAIDDLLAAEAKA